MRITWNAAFLSGLTRMASSCAKGIGPSYIDADFFGPPDPVGAFARNYRVPVSGADLRPVPESLETLLGQWMGDPPVAGSLLHWIRLQMGEPGQVWRPANEKALVEALSLYADGTGPFYFMEELIFASFPDGMACFMLGNDE